MITEYATDFDVTSIIETKHVWYDIGRIVVYTGDDIPPAPSRIIPTSDFRARFTDAEMDAIMSLAYVGTGDAIARRILLKLQTRTDIDLDLQAVIDGMSYWVANGIMTQDRANEILN